MVFQHLNQYIKAQNRTADAHDEDGEDEVFLAVDMPAPKKTFRSPGEAVKRLIAEN